MSKIIQKNTRILYNLHLKGNYYKLAFNIPGIAAIAQPGQFLTLRINQAYRPLLRRPFSIHRVNPQIEILYEVVGRGTELLSQKKAGQYIDILGPLGQGFNLTGNGKNLRHYLIAGGMGIAPLFFLAQRLIEQRIQYNNHKPIILIGARTKAEVISKRDFINLGLDVRISTDDGSVGYKGKVTDLLSHLLKTKIHQLSNIYACGPRPMLVAVSTISKRHNIPTQISLDEYMACGLGVCLGCMVKTTEGQQLVCRDGPVFDATKIKW